MADAHTLVAPRQATHTTRPLAVYLFQPKLQLVLLSHAVQHLHSASEACLELNQWLSLYHTKDQSRLHLALRIIIECQGAIKLTAQLGKAGNSVYLEHQIQRLNYGDNCFICGQVTILKI